MRSVVTEGLSPFFLVLLRSILPRFRSSGQRPPAASARAAAIAGGKVDSLSVGQTALEAEERARLNCMRYVLNSFSYDNKNKNVAIPTDTEIVGTVKEMYRYT